MSDQANMHAWSGNAVSDYSAEESSAELCDSGLPDPEVCDVLHIPPTETAVISEAWSRGWVFHFHKVTVCRIHYPPRSNAMHSPLSLHRATQFNVQ